MRDGSVPQNEEEWKEAFSEFKKLNSADKMKENQTMDILKEGILSNMMKINGGKGMKLEDGHDLADICRKNSTSNWFIFNDKDLLHLDK